MILAGIEYAETGTYTSAVRPPVDNPSKIPPPVICLHGIGGGIESFRPQLEGLPSAAGGKKGFRTISWSMPGYGRSKLWDWPPSFMSLSRSLAGFIEALGAAPAHLVGHSIGGMIAIEHAAFLPEQVASLCLIGTTPAFGGRDGNFKKSFLKARLEPLDAGMSMERMAAEAAPGLVGSGADPEVVETVREQLARVPEKTWRGILRCITTFDRRDELPHIAMPTCVIAGSEDRNAPATTMERMASKIPMAEYHLIEGAGHMIPQETPETVNRILRDFWERRVQ